MSFRMQKILHFLQTRSSWQTLLFMIFCLSSGPLFASENSAKPQILFNLSVIPVTNAMISTWIIATLMIAGAFFFNHSLKNGTSKKFTNLVEFAVSGLFLFFQDLIGDSLARKAFCFLGSVFFFILFLNWAELIPGIGSIGWGNVTAEGFKIETPLLRGANADLNMTLALGMLFFLFWLYLSIKLNGIKGFILHIFGPKGDTTGIMAIVMIIVFIAVGFLESISMMIRPLSLALRLYGNILAGGVLVETMIQKVPALGWLIPVPFYMMEIMVGLIQALVFTLLSAIFIMLSCAHEDDQDMAHEA